VLFGEKRSKQSKIWEICNYSSLLRLPSLRYTHRMSDPSIGRPEIPNHQYNQWLDDLRPFLKLGESLNSAIEDAGLHRHRTVLYEKYRENGDFTHAVDQFREYPGKLANNILVRILFDVDEKIKRGMEPTSEEMKNVRFFAEKHRSAQTYFVSRTEIASTDGSKLGTIIETLDKGTDYVEVARMAAQQVENAELKQESTPISELSNEQNPIQAS
jgi:hypothetical protein